VSVFRLYSVSFSEYTVSVVRNVQCQLFGIYSASCSEYTVSVFRTIQCQFFGMYNVSCLEYTVSVVRNIRCQFFGLYSVSFSECRVSVVRNIQCQFPEDSVIFSATDRSQNIILHNIYFFVSKQISTEEYFICIQFVTYKLQSFFTSFRPR
jgi:hypothetical protein